MSTYLHFVLSPHPGVPWSTIKTQIFQSFNVARQSFINLSWVFKVIRSIMAHLQQCIMTILGLRSILALLRGRFTLIQKTQRCNIEPWQWKCILSIPLDKGLSKELLLSYHYKAPQNRNISKAVLMLNRYPRPGIAEMWPFAAFKHPAK